MTHSALSRRIWSHTVDGLLTPQALERRPIAWATTKQVIISHINQIGWHVLPPGLKWEMGWGERRENVVHIQEIAGHHHIDTDWLRDDVIVDY
jgi:hypothetical protein